jgi:hypothetical protein
MTHNFYLIAIFQLCTGTQTKDIYKYHRKQALKRHDESKAYIIEDRLSRTYAEISELVDDAQQVLLYQRMA